MNPKQLLGLAMLLPLMIGTGKASETANGSTTIPTFQDVCAQLPTRELILDLEQESLRYGARLDASEFLASVLNVLLKANYRVRLSDQFIESEIKYYRENLEMPNGTSGAILTCLEKARGSGTLDWDCFKGEFIRGVFEKTYPREEWQRSYASIYEQPLWKTSQVILQDLASGLKPKRALAAETRPRKQRKHSSPASGP